MQARVGHFEAACLAIYAAMIMDMVDGRLARLTGTESEFGSQYDSLADMVSFGVVPALVAFDYVLSDLGRLGSLVAFIYIACTALRLARFNAIQSDDQRCFVGLPSPGAAGVVASVIWVCVDYGVDAAHYSSGVLACIIVAVALSMVSGIRYRSFKDVDFRDKIPFIGVIALVLTFAIIYLDPPLAFCSLARFM